MSENNAMIPIPCRIDRIVRETDAEFTFRILYNGKMPQDGQFFQLSIPKVGEAPISVSGRGDGFVEFTIRKVGRLTEGVFNLRDPAYDNAIKMIREADCLIIGGTSLEVGSASGLAHSYHGKHVVIINKGKTRMEGKADLVFHDSIGKVLGQINCIG